MENSLEVWAVLEKAPREQGAGPRMFAQARSNDSFSISVVTILMYLLSIVASHLCISNDLGLYYQLLSPYNTGNLESARVKKETG